MSGKYPTEARRLYEAGKEIIDRCVAPDMYHNAMSLLERAVLEAGAAARFAPAFTGCSACQDAFECKQAKRCRVDADIEHTKKTLNGMVSHYMMESTPTGDNGFFRRWFMSGGLQGQARRVEQVLNNMIGVSSRRSSPAFASHTCGRSTPACKRCAEFEQEVKLDNERLHQLDMLLDQIPPCPVHGRCFSHAIEWVINKKSWPAVTIGAFTLSQQHKDMIQIRHETGETWVTDTVSLTKLLAKFWAENF